MAAIAVDYFGYVVLEHSIPGLNDISEKIQNWSVEPRSTVNT